MAQTDTGPDTTDEVPKCSQCGDPNPDHIRGHADDGKPLCGMCIIANDPILGDGSPLMRS